MDDLDKLSCKEEILEVSDVEHSANDEFKEMEHKPKKKKRRRREIDMPAALTTAGGGAAAAAGAQRRAINLFRAGRDGVEAEWERFTTRCVPPPAPPRRLLSSKPRPKRIKLSDEDETDDEGHHKKLLRRLSPGPNREPRTCVLKASQKRRPLSRLLEQLLRNLEKRDPHQFFAWPVNDTFAPNYSNIIRKPMDFSTIKQKIDDNEYKSLNCFISDFKLMCNNAMKYNKVGTVYHKAAKRLLHAGLKQLTPHKLRPLGDILTYMYEIPIRELGFDIGKMDVHKVLKGSSPMKSGGSEAEVVSDGQDRPDGDSVKIQMEAAREQHRRRLAKKAFPRMDAEGKTMLCLVSGPVEGSGEDKPMTLGAYVGKLVHGTGTLYTPREDRRNLVKGVKPLHYGPFSSYAPSYDGTFASLTKEESHLLYHTLPTEMGQGNEELLRFAPDSPWTAIYDMEAMFPDKKQQEATPPSEDNDISKIKVDVDHLRTLSEVGIDMEFLNEMEEDIAASQHDYGLAGALQHSCELLRRLAREQRDRLSSPVPWHLALVPRPGAGERESARLAVAALRGMAARVRPRHVAPLHVLRKAMGVTLDHLDTPLPLPADDFEPEPEPRDNASEHDSTHT